MPDVVLYQFPAVEGFPSVSPYCGKVHLALRLKGIAYQTRSTLRPKSLVWNGQVPYLTWDGQGHTDSTAILRFLDQQVPSPRLFPEDPKLAAEAHVLEDWADESLYWYAVYSKFVHPEGWAFFRPIFARSMPAALRLIAPGVTHRKMTARLREQGVLRRSAEQIVSEFDAHLDAIDVRLEGRRYLVGDAISIADLSVVAMLEQLARQPIFGAHLAARSRIVELIARVAAEANRSSAVVAPLR